MKTSVNKSFVLAIYMLGFINVYAQGEEEPPPEPPGGGPLEGEVPIDENLLALLIIALILGIYTIYSQSIKTKKH